MESPIGSLIFLVVLVAVFWLLLLRPQKKRVEQHRRLVETLGNGDEVVTIGGVFGRVSSLRAEDLDLEIAPGTTVRVLKSAIARKLTEDEPEEELEPGEAEEVEEVEEEGHA